MDLQTIVENEAYAQEDELRALKTALQEETTHLGVPNMKTVMDAMITQARVEILYKVLGKAR